MQKLKIFLSKTKTIWLFLVVLAIFGKNIKFQIIGYIERNLDKSRQYLAKGTKKDLIKFNNLLEAAAKIPPESWEQKYKDIPIKDKYKVFYVTNNGGEYSYAKYFKHAAEKKGWQVEIVWDRLHGREKEFLEFDPDFVIFTHMIDYPSHMSSEIKTHRSRKYIMQPVPLTLQKFDHFIDPTATKPLGRFRELINISDGIFISGGSEIGVYKPFYENSNKPFNAIQLLPLVPFVDNEPAEPKKLAWVGMGWDKFRASERYKKFITLLSDNIPMRIYGGYNSFSYLKPGVYGGYIPAGMDNIDALRKNGIYLLTQTDLHIKAGIPSARIFEAAAANVVTISDKHPFTMKHFGDSMLYFDQNTSPEEMYKQVKNHVDWIMANPDKAKEMARRAHKIFLEKFTLEQDLPRIARMHEYVLNEIKEKNLDYTLAY